MTVDAIVKDLICYKLRSSFRHDNSQLIINEGSLFTMEADQIENGLQNIIDTIKDQSDDYSKLMVLKRLLMSVRESDCL